MWQAQYQTTTDIPAEKLFRAISDINTWSHWDAGLEFARIDGPATAGSTFVLKPKGGPTVQMSIEELRSPVRMVDIAHLPLASCVPATSFCSPALKPACGFRSRCGDRSVFSGAGWSEKSSSMKHPRRQQPSFDMRCAAPDASSSVSSGDRA